KGAARPPGWSDRTQGRTMDGTRAAADVGEEPAQGRPGASAGSALRHDVAVQRPPDPARQPVEGVGTGLAAGKGIPQGPARRVAQGCRQRATVEPGARPLRGGEMGDAGPTGQPENRAEGQRPEKG